MRFTFLYILTSFTFFNVHSQQIAKSEYGSFLLKNATINTVTQGIKNGDLLIKDGKIFAIAPMINTQPDYKVIDCSGKFIYPGMIDSGTKLGLTEIDAVSITNDYNEIGDVIPHMQALTAVNPNSVSIPVTRTNGVTTVLTAPSGGKFPGTAALIDLHGYNPDDMYAGFKGIVLNFPSTGRRGRWDRRTDEDIKTDSEKALKTLNDAWQNAQLYAKIDSAALAMAKTKDTYQPEYAALADVVKGKLPLLVEVNKKEDILSALKWIKDQKVKAILTGVSEGWRVAKELADAKIDVITGPVMDTPRRDYDRYDAAYTNAGKMHKAGVKVALRTDNDENVRNLPFNAGFAAAYGLGKEEALKSVTINPAEMFGVSKYIGSIEEGKIANIIITDGDPFETKTQVLYLFIKGWKVPLESRQTLLYDEFLNRTPGIKK